MKLKQYKQEVCRNERCKNNKVEINKKNVYVCSNCGNQVRPKQIEIAHARLGDFERYLKVYCYEEVVERLIKSYSRAKKTFLFRISGTLKNNNVKYLFMI